MGENNEDSKKATIGDSKVESLSLDKSAKKSKKSVNLPRNKKLGLFLVIVVGAIFAGLLTYLYISKKSVNITEVVQTVSPEDAGKSLLEEYENRKKQYEEQSKTPGQNVADLQDKLKMAEENGDEIQKATLYTNLAFEARDAGKNELAKEYAKKALPYYQSMSDEVKYLNANLIENLEKIING
jgi:uncharacterized protein HemX